MKNIFLLKKKADKNLHSLCAFRFYYSFHLTIDETFKELI